MVAIVTGSGLGLLRDSGLVLGSRGQLGSASLGQANLGVTVNAANGNLVLQSTDEILIGKGPDDIVVNTYNSQGTYTTNDWQENFQRHVAGLTGTVNTSGSTITRYAADGSATVYTYDTTKALYVGNEGGGAYDTLAYGSGQWTWTEGKSRATELYDTAANGGRLVWSKDADLNTLTYTYSGSLLTRITTANGDYTDFTYSGTLLQAIVTHYTDSSGAHSLTRTYYSYDVSNRLQTVTVDLSPNDNVTTDNNTYVTTYTYDGTSTRVASVSQSDGTSLQIAYVQVGSVYKVSSLTQLVTWKTTTNTKTYATTSFDYSVANQTTVTDALGNQTVMVYDAKGQLTKLVEPAATASADPQTTVFTYDTNGNLLYSGPSSDPMFNNIALDWNDLNTSGGVATTQSTEIDGGVSVYRRQTTTTPASGWYMRLGQSQPAWTPVNAGQTVQFSVYTATTNASSVRLYMMFRDASGTLLTSTYSTVATGGTLGASGVSTANLGIKSAVAPTGAVYVELNVQVYSDGTGPLSVAIAEPMISVDGSGLQPAYAYTYDTRGNLLTKTDSLGNQTVFTYDAINQMLTKTTSSSTGTSQSTRYVYDAESHVVYTISPLGEVTQYLYDAQGRQTNIIQYTTQADLYTTAGNPSASTMDTWVLAVTDKGTTRRTDITYDLYDTRGHPAQVTTYSTNNADGSGNTIASSIRYVYDTAGNLLQRILGEGTEVYTYDGLVRMTSRKDANGNITQTVYNNAAVDPNGWMTWSSATTLANGTTTVTSIHDLAGELISLTTKGLDGVSLTPTYISATTTYEYDLNGNLVQSTDPTGISTYHVYDDRNRKVADVVPDGTVTAYTYNENDQVVASVAYATALTTTQLSSLANESAAAPLGLTDVTPATSANDRWSWNVYDAAGHLAESIDALGYATAYTYDTAGQLISTTQYANPLSSTTVTGFKTVAPLSLVLPTANVTYDRTVRMLYDDDGRVAGVLDADGYLTETIYDDTGLKIRTVAYATATTASLRATGTLSALRASAATAGSDIYNWFVYDNAGHLVASIDGEGNAIRYDNYNDMGYAEKVTMGQVFNPTTLIATSPTFPLAAPTGTLEITTYDYDEYGHMRSETLTLTGGTAEITTYTYDQLYNLTSFRADTASAADGSVDRRKAVYRYDGLSRLLGTLSGVGSTSLAVSPTQDQIDTLWNSNKATYATIYTYDLAGRLTTRTDADGVRTLYYYDIDGRQNYQVDGAGDVVMYGYDVFGEQTDITRYKTAISTSGLNGGVVTSLTVAANSEDSHSQVAYDLVGNATILTDANTKVTTYTYDAFGDVTRVVDPLLLQTAMTYSRRGLLLTSTADAVSGGLNLATTYGYDAFGRTATITDASGTLRSTTYDRASNVKTQVDGLGKTTSFTYDGFGHVLTTTDRNGNTTTYAYTLFDRQVTITDPLGFVSVTKTNAYGQTVSIKDRTGVTTTYAYDADGNLVSTTDPLGNVTMQGFTHADRVDTITSAAGRVTKYEYDAAGRTWKQRVDPNGLNLTTVWAYDGKDQTISVTDPTNVVTSYTYDLDGRKLTAVVDPGGLNLTTTWVYDDDGRVSNETTAGGVQTAYTYDHAHRVIDTNLDPGSGHIHLHTTYVYDADGNLIQKTDQAGKVWRYAYDAENRLTFAIDPLGAVTRTVYDNEGQVLQTIQFATFYITPGNPDDPTMGTWAGTAATAGDLVSRSVYDADGNEIYRIDASGTVTKVSYDNEGRVRMTTTYLATYSVSGQPTLTAMNTWVTANSAAGSFYVRTIYDVDGRIAYTIGNAVTTDKSSLVTGYSYDADGNVTQTVQYTTAYTTSGAKTQSTLDTWRDANKNPVNDRTTTYSYDNAGRLASTVDGENYKTDYVYDNDGRVRQTTRYAVSAPTVTVVNRHAYDAAGRMVYDINPIGAVTRYTYDGDGRVTSATRYNAKYTLTDVPLAGAMDTWRQSFASPTNDIVTYAVYDPAGRKTYTIDAAGALTAYNFNGNGHITKITSYAAAYDGADMAYGTITTWIGQHNVTANRVTSSTYDDAGKLTSVTDPMGYVTRYVYDTLGRHAYVIDQAGAVTGYTYDADGQVTKTIQYATLNTSTGVQTLANMAAWGSEGANDLVTSATYDGYGHMLTATDGRGNVTTYTYNRNGDILTVLTPQNDGTTDYPTVNYYNTFGELTKVTDPRGKYGYFYYDRLGRQNLQVDAEAFATATTYDLNDEVVSVTRYYVRASGANATTRPTITTNAKDNTTSFTRDADGRVLTSTDGNGYVTSYLYDTLGTHKTMTNALGAQVSYVYDKRGLLISQTTPGSSVTDGTGTNIVSTTTAPASTTAYVYDIFGDRTQMIEAQGRPEQRTTTYVYDENDRLTQQKADQVTVTATNGTTSTVTPTQDFTYDARGNLITSTDANRAVTTSYYDVFDRKTIQIDALGYLTAWTYDANGNVLTQTAYAAVYDGANMAYGTVTAWIGQHNVTANRVTSYAYDKDNRRTTASVQGVTTGYWNGTTWTSATGAVTTTTVYDACGNVIQQIDGNNNSTWFFYDKLGRKTAQVDAGLYLTTYALDHEGNVTKQTQYANALSAAPTAGGTQPAGTTDPAGKDRITDFTYDHDGNRLTEVRENVAYSTIDANTGVLTAQTPAILGVSFTYNALNQVTQKTEATGDKTTYTYDTVGRVVKMTTASGAANAMTTLSVYDGLGNLTRSVAYSGAASGTPSDANAENTSFTYGAGGRLATKTDAMNFVVSYGYDANGNTTFESYTRKLSDGTTPIVEATVTGYDALGRTILSTKSTQNTTTGVWTQSDTTDNFYDAFGEVVARGTNAGRNIAKAQQYADYDGAGRVWRTNMEGGVTKVFGYDGSGNQTLKIIKPASNDLVTAADFAAANSLTGTIKTYNVYDSRNELTDVIKRTNASGDGTLTSVSNVAGAPTVAKFSVTAHSGDLGGYATVKIKVLLSTSSITLNNGTGAVHVAITSELGTQTYDLGAGVRDCGTYDLSFFNPAGGGEALFHNYQVVITQDGVTNSIVNQSFTTKGGMGNSALMDVPVVTKVTLGSDIEFRGVNTAATALTLYARPNGSNGGYTKVTATQMYDDDNNPIPGAFTYDIAQPPFNKTASSAWDVEYLATDAQGHVLDAKAGIVTLGTGSFPQASTTGFAAVPIFTATLVSGSWQLAANTVVAAYSDFKQAFNAFGDVTSQIDANGNTTNLTYDVLGHLTKRESPMVTVVGEDVYGNVTIASAKPTDVYYYDQSGRQVGHLNANGYLTTQALLAGTGYGGSDALVATQFNPDTGKIISTYDIYGNLKTQTDGELNVTTYTYDADNRLLTVSHPDRTTADNYTYGAIRQLVDTYGYDGLGQRVTHSNNVLKNSQNATAVETTDYDVEGRIVTEVNFGGQVTVYGYSWTSGTATTRVSAGKGDSGYWTTDRYVRRGNAAIVNSGGAHSSTFVDIFGKTLISQDEGGHTTTFGYDWAAQVTDQDNTSGQSLDYSYTINGQVASITDNATAMKSVYAYDNNGNRTLEAYFTTGSSPVYYQNETISYDALNRAAEIKDVKADITYSYDANGNRRHILSVYTLPGYANTTQDYWYKYDNMDRFVLTKGVLSGSSIVTGTTGQLISYNKRGDRKSVTYGADNHKEDYTYSVDGYLETISINNLLDATRTLDALGRLTSYAEFQSNGTTVLLTRAMTYDNENRVLDEVDLTNTTTTGGAAITYKSHIVNQYVTYSHDDVHNTTITIDDGVLVLSNNYQSQIQNGTESTAVRTETDYSYVWWNDAKTQAVSVHGYDTNNPNGYLWQPGGAQYTYDVNGNLIQVHDGETGGNTVNRTLNYKTDMFGQVLTRQETDILSAGAQRTFLYLNGQMVGDFGNDQLDSEIDYAQQLQTDRNNASHAGQQWYTGTDTATKIVGLNAHFDTYEAYNAASVDQTGSAYTVTADQDLQTLAQTLWGDASLWYLIADANGLDAGANLATGRTLSIPGKVTSLHNNANTFKPYDPSDALSNTTPTLPKEPQPPAPKEQGCGMIGQMLVSIIAIAVAAILTEGATIGMAHIFGEAAVEAAADASLAATIAGGAVAGLAGGVASQTFAVATGIQSRFDWGAVAMSAIGGGVSAGVGFAIKGPGILAGVGRGLATSAITQGVDMAVGLQKKFDWTGLAVAGVQGGVTAAVDQWAAGKVKWWLPDGTQLYSRAPLGDISKGVLNGAASLMAGAVTRSLLTGQSLGKSLREGLPDAISSTVGNLIAEGIEHAMWARPAVIHPDPLDGGGPITQLGVKPYVDQQLDTTLPDAIVLNTEVVVDGPSHSVRKGEHVWHTAHDTSSSDDGSIGTHINSTGSKARPYSDPKHNQIIPEGGLVPDVYLKTYQSGTELRQITHGGADENIYYYMVDADGNTSPEFTLQATDYDTNLVIKVPGFGEITLITGSKPGVAQRDWDIFTNALQDSASEINLGDRAIGDMFVSGAKSTGSFIANNWTEFTQDPYGYMSNVAHSAAQGAQNTATAVVNQAKNAPAAVAQDYNYAMHRLGTAEGWHDTYQDAVKAVDGAKAALVDGYNYVMAEKDQLVGEFQDGTWDEKWSERIGGGLLPTAETLALGGADGIAERGVVNVAEKEALSLVEKEAVSYGEKGVASYAEKSGLSQLERGGVRQSFESGGARQGLEREVSPIAERFGPYKAPMLPRPGGELVRKDYKPTLMVHAVSSFIGATSSLSGYYAGASGSDLVFRKGGATKEGAIAAVLSGALGGWVAPYKPFRNNLATTMALGAGTNVLQYKLQAIMDPSAGDNWVGTSSAAGLGALGSLYGGPFTNEYSMIATRNLLKTFGIPVVQNFFPSSPKKGD